MEPAAPWVKFPAADREPSTSPLDVGPPGLWVHLAFLPVALCVLYAVSSPGWSFLAALVGVGGVGLWSLAWLALAVAHGASRFRNRGQRRDLGGRSEAWLLVGPVLVVLLAALVVTGAAAGPVRARPRRLRSGSGTGGRPVDGPDERRGRGPAHDGGRTPPDRHLQGPRGEPGPGRGVLPPTERGYRLSRRRLRAPSRRSPSGPGPFTPSSELGGAWFETMTFRSLGGGWYAWEAVQ